MLLKNINTSEFDYNLPDEKIAQFPLEERDGSKLLVYDGESSIKDSNFRDIAQFLPSNSLIVFNETRVIRARMEFFKETGAKIEIFCLEPILPSAEFASALNVKHHCSWKCFVGNIKKWKEGALSSMLYIQGNNIELKVTLNSAQSDGFIIDFDWDGDTVFGDIVEYFGHIPLPPYIKREDQESDAQRYQTIFANIDGSVAAPTAGLHFTENVMSSLGKKGIKTTQVVLHVGAGTFKPMKSESITLHEMHCETIIVTKETLELILKNLDINIINVGTTTVRTMESLYWFGVKLIVDGFDTYSRLEVNQFDPYQEKYNIEIQPKDSIMAILDFMQIQGLDEISGATRLMIAPGYKFRLTNILITNFHQPQSTLLLLVSAFSNGKWKEIYDYAISNSYRFLSYGDSCLFINNMK